MTETFDEPTFVSRGSVYADLKFYDYQCQAKGCGETDRVRLFPNETPTPYLLCICGARQRDGQSGTMTMIRGPYHPDDDAPEAPAENVPAQP